MIKWNAVLIKRISISIWWKWNSYTNMIFSKNMNYVFVIFSANDIAILDLEIKAKISSGSFYHEFHKLDIYQFIVRMFLWSFKHDIFFVLKICCVLPEKLFCCIMKLSFCVDIFIYFIYTSTFSFRHGQFFSKKKISHSHSNKIEFKILL